MIDLATKDLGLALDLGQQLGLNLVTGRSAKETYAAAQEQGHGRSDWTAIYAVARDRLKHRKK
jgi:4-hydroxybutyrate dehydrogenase/sulfolactaldehyde 3-reductase